jgi:hypothetical protein
MAVFNPIISKEPVKKTRFFKSPQGPVPGNVFIYVGNNNVTTIENSALTWGELFMGSYHTVYSVDITPHTIEMREQFSTIEPDEKFEVSFTLICKVINAEEVVKRNLCDVEASIQPILYKRAIGITRKKKADEYEDVRKDLNEIKGDLSVEFKIMGLELDMFYTDVMPERGALDRIKRRKDGLLELDDQAELKKRHIQRTEEVEAAEIKQTSSRLNAWLELIQKCPDTRLVSKLLAAKNNDEARIALDLAKAENNQFVNVFIQVMEKMKDLGIDIKDVSQDMLQRMYLNQVNIGASSMLNSSEDMQKKARAALDSDDEEEVHDVKEVQDVKEEEPEYKNVDESSKEN